MNKLHWTPKFIRSFKKASKKSSQLLQKIEIALSKIQEDYTEPSLKSHRLKGNLKGFWAASIDYNYRIVFEIIEVESNVEIILHVVGTHDEVY